ncbi:MAG: septum formation initiator family protein [Verrucomicrobia bacterium]|nr:septum formation initiator family protein [Verrucomicrobiota bacterium]
MNVRTIWGVLTRVVLVLVVVASALLVGVWYLPAIQRNRTMREERLRLAEQIQQAEHQIQQREAAIESLRHDPRTIERLARERLGLARPGETVVLFVSPQTNAVEGLRAP